MDDNGNLIYYIVLGIIYLVSRFFGKKKQPVKPQAKRKVADPQRRDEPKPVQAPTAEKEEAPMSFEDILRELSGARQPKPEPDPEPVTYTAPIVQEEKKPIYAKQLESRSQPNYSLDEMDRIAVDYNVPKSIGSNVLPDSEFIAAERKDLTFKRDEHYTIDEKESTDYLSILNESNGPARAFVLSEIFSRKY